SITKLTSQKKKKNYFFHFPSSLYTSNAVLTATGAPASSSLADKLFIKKTLTPFTNLSVFLSLSHLSLSLQQQHRTRSPPLPTASIIYLFIYLFSLSLVYL
ncbi:hypothetical protein CFOL_v3_12933, partial [Cephalotus follicularis]